QPAAHVRNPFGHVRVRRPVGDATVVIQLEVIVRVDQTRQDDGALQIDDRVAPLRPLADVNDARGKPDRLGDAVPGHAVRGDERDRGAPWNHAFTAWKITTTGGLPHLRRNDFTAGSVSSSLKRGSRTATICSPADATASR